MKKIYFLILIFSILLSGCVLINNNGIKISSIENKQNSNETSLSANNLELKTYKNETYKFNLKYFSDWYFNEEHNIKVFIKKPTKIENILAYNFTEKDCFVSYEVLDNSNNKTLEEMFKNLVNREYVKLGDNNFLTYSNNSNNDVSYVVMLKTNQPIVFTTPLNSLCQKQVEEILSFYTLSS